MLRKLVLVFGGGVYRCYETGFVIYNGAAGCLRNTTAKGGVRVIDSVCDV